MFTHTVLVWCDTVGFSHANGGALRLYLFVNIQLNWQHLKHMWIYRRILLLDDTRKSRP